MQSSRNGHEVMYLSILLPMCGINACAYASHSRALAIANKCY